MLVAKSYDTVIQLLTQSRYELRPRRQVAQERVDTYLQVYVFSHDSSFLSGYTSSVARSKDKMDGQILCMYRW